jgi:hypothetical protein
MFWFVISVRLPTIRKIQKPAREPTRRGTTREGEMHVFKLDFGDSVQNIFWNQWVDVKEDPAANQDKIAAFEAQRFPFTYVESISLSGSASQTIYPKKSGNSLIDKIVKSKEPKPKSQLYSECLQSISANVNQIFMSRTSIDVTIRTNVIGTNPIAGRIGTKEGVRAERTFYLMERSAEEKWNYSIKKSGSNPAHCMLVKIRVKVCKPILLLFTRLPVLSPRKECF